MQLTNVFRQGTTTNGTTSASSQAVTLGPQTRLLRVKVAADTWVLISATNVAATAANAMLVQASSPAEYFRVNCSDVVTFLQVSAAGSISLAEMTL